jgi:hypothetical protein
MFRFHSSFRRRANRIAGAKPLISGAKDIARRGSERSDPTALISIKPSCTRL